MLFCVRTAHNHLKTRWCSVQFKTASMRWEKPIRAPPRLSEVSPTLPLKRFQCSSDWRWPFLVLSRKMVWRFPALSTPLLQLRCHTLVWDNTLLFSATGNFDTVSLQQLHTRPTLWKNWLNARKAPSYPMENQLMLVYSDSVWSDKARTNVETFGRNFDAL